LAVHMKVRLSYFQVDRSESSKKVTIVFPYLWVNYNDTATEPWLDCGKSFPNGPTIQGSEIYWNIVSYPDI
jgi:hypothetical protein